ncbi:hypothetical protein Ataiwa_11980 [Algoriphagus taiwanensis]|uniref:Uncharacterized protein n=1 Tax=Algoriphagus taiwanensis TaxID=1445656 RepID=A0ABQ6PZ99_9BACT|nr:hypothetical protein Ataiwa_11980 [Algoriphagus taiwanensis]
MDYIISFILPHQNLKFGSFNRFPDFFTLFKQPIEPILTEIVVHSKNKHLNLNFRDKILN